MSTATSHGRYTGRPATELAATVRSGQVSAVAVVAEHLDRIAALDDRVGAFMAVRREEALAEARELDRRPDLADLPLAGVPVAVKDNIAVEGLPTRGGNPLTGTAPATSDHVVVTRLRAAGAVVVGTTRVPELCVWPFTDGPLGVARNPWHLDRTPGGSSGGSAAAAAAGFVPLAHGNDGLGSIRIPAACCGLLGIKPAAGTVPALIGADAWTGMAENGPLATTVADAALGLSVMAADPDLARLVSLPEHPSRPLAIALVVTAPVPGVRIDPAYRAAAVAAARALRAAGHDVRPARLPTPPAVIRAGMARWFAGSEADAALAGVDRSGLPVRTRTHAALGRVARRLGWVRPEDTDRWRARLAPFFEQFDVVLSPGLAAPPPAADGHAERGWAANYQLATAFTGGLHAPWNIAGYPSIAVPAAVGHPDGTPLSVMLSCTDRPQHPDGPDRGEPLLLALAAQLEATLPWPRLAPLP